MKKKTLLFGLAMLATVSITLASCVKSSTPAGTSVPAETPSTTVNGQEPEQSTSNGGQATPTSTQGAATPTTTQGGQATPTTSQGGQTPTSSTTEDEDDEITTGYGTGLTAFSTLKSHFTGKDSKSRVQLEDDLTVNGFTFGKKSVLDSNDTILNTQGSVVEINLPSTGNIILAATWGSSDNGKVYVYKVENDEETEIYHSTSSIANKGTVSLDFSNSPLGAGVYRIKGLKDKDSTGASLAITKICYEVALEKFTVSFHPNNGDTIEAQQVTNGRTVTLPTVSKSGYKLEGWYTTSTFDTNSEFTSSTAVTGNLDLYAKWRELNADEKATVSFSVNRTDVTYTSIEVEKGKPVATPQTISVNGYRFDGWYTNSACTTKYNGGNISADTILYGKYIEQCTITYKDSGNNVITTKNVDYETAFQNVESVTAPYVQGKIFEYWVKEGTTVEFTGTEDITTNITLVAKYRDQTAADVTINFTAQEGLEEAAYLEFDKYDAAEAYSLYKVYDNGTTTKLTEKNYYVTETATSARIDILGLSAGNYKFMVAPVIAGNDVVSLGKQTNTLAVEAYDRSGFAFFNYNEGVGAYKDNGELKDNAIVLYVTDQNKNTVTLSYGGVTVTGIGNILNSVGADNGSGTASNGGKANTNQGIIKKLGDNNIPLVVRFVGCVSNTGLYQRSTFNASSAPLINGLTIYDSIDNGGTAGDNGHMARMKSGKNITIEGVGSNATIDGWGFHFMAESSSPTLGKSFEVRNLKFINTPEDAIGMEGIQASKNASSDLSASVERCWIHNNEFYGPSISSPAESDKSEGDGSCDFKRGQYLTVSYNYFEGCHKTNLVGSADYSLQFNLTYHHNYWYMCKARGPLTRRANVHMYNNVFYGQTDYAMNTRADAYIYSEYNLFYACKSPQAVEGGAIKSYNDSISSVIWNKGSQATVVTDKSTRVSNNCQFSARNINYSNFDTDSTQSYIPSNDYYLQEDVTEARKVIYARCGVQKNTLIDPSTVSMSDISYVNEVIKNATVHDLSVPSTTTNIGKISKNIYAFRITDYATVTIDTGSAGVLLNEAGVLMVEGNGTCVLTPGIYIVQPIAFQPGSALGGKVTQLQFKEFTLSSLKLESYDSSAFSATLIEAFENAYSQIPSTITYTNACYSALSKALSAYNAIPQNARDNVSAQYTSLTNKINEYVALGVSYVEGLIDAIPATVTTENSSSVITARNAYNELVNVAPSAVVSNYNKLITAEGQMESIAKDIFISLANAIPSTITYTSECNTAISNAETAYDSLDSDQKNDSNVKTAYTKVTNARNTYNSLENVAQVNALIASANSLTSYQEAYTAYNALSASEKSSVTGYSNMVVAYTIALINDIGTVTTSSGAKITAARTVYDTLTSAEKASVTNYSTLTDAEAAYDALGASMIRWSYDGTYSNEAVTSSGNAKNESKAFDGVTYSKGLKMESSAGQVQITITKAMKLTVYQSGGTKLKINGNAVAVGDLVNYNLAAGTYTITKGDGSAVVYAVVLQ